MPDRRTPAAPLAIALALALALSACAPPAFQVRFEPSGAPLTARSAEKLAASTDIRALSSVTTTDAPALRSRMLSELRTKGALGVRAADLLTVGFPARTASVPVLVRVCSVDATSAIVVVEAFGDPGGTLTHRRLWVFGEASGAVIRAASFR
jgi:hypothetical protein